MILQSLYELYDRLKDDPDYRIARPGYSVQKITFKVVLRPDGGLFDIQDIRERTNGKLVPTQMIVPGGDKSTGGVTANSVHNKVRLLRNDLPFVVGGKIDESTNEITGKKEKRISATTLEFEAFKAFHLGLMEKIDDSAFATVCRFLKSWDPQNVFSHQDWIELGSGQGVFQILGESEYVHRRPAIVAWWDSQLSLHTNISPVIGQCLITGETKPIARLHEPKIKRVALSSGAPIVAFDKGNDAACSYGKDKQQAFNAPVSEVAAFSYATALNALLDGPMNSKHSFNLGDAVVVFWTDRPTNTEDVFAQFASAGSTGLEDPESQDLALRGKIETFLKALRQGRGTYTELEDNSDGVSFFILGMTGQAKGRIGIRFFYRGTIQELLDHLRCHFNDIKNLPQPASKKRKADPEFPSIRLLLDQTCPKKKNGKADREKIPPILAGPLLRSIITGARYPGGLYSAVIRRIHADREINYARACVIKGYLVRNLKQEVSMSLDVERLDPAYRMGRLFAVLEKAQLEAHSDENGRPNINATIRDRFYSSASATPRSVFPRLLRTYQHHLAKLSGGLKVKREKLVQEILGPLCAFPARFNLSEQGLFALGYYHQNRSLYTKGTESNENQERTTE